MFINIPVFIITLAIGMLFIYLYNPPTRPIYVYPTPDNIHKVDYEDKTGTCFRYEPVEVQCNDKSGVLGYPVQI